VTTLLSGAHQEPVAAMVALVYLDRISLSFPSFAISKGNYASLFAMSLVVTAKFLDDWRLRSSDWAQLLSNAVCADVHPAQINRMEIDFLSMLRWKIFVSGQDLQELVDRAEKALCRTRSSGTLVRVKTGVIVETMNLAQLRATQPEPPLRVTRRRSTVLQEVLRAAANLVGVPCGEPISCGEQAPQDSDQSRQERRSTWSGPVNMRSLIPRRRSLDSLLGRHDPQTATPQSVS